MLNSSFITFNCPVVKSFRMYNSLLFFVSYIPLFLFAVNKQMKYKPVGQNRNIRWAITLKRVKHVKTWYNHFHLINSVKSTFFVICMSEHQLSQY